MQNKQFRLGPLLLTATPGTNLLNPPASTGGVGAGTPNLFIAVKHIRVVNTSSSAAKLNLFLGATGGSAAGTELVASGKSIAGNDVLDFYTPGLRLDVANFLTGHSDVASVLSLTLIGEIGVA